MIIKMIRAQLILEDQAIKEKAKEWSLPLIKEKNIDNKITQVISNLRLKDEQHKAIVMEIFRFRIGDYVGHELLAAVYRKDSQPELAVKDSIQHLNSEMLINSHNLNIFNFPIYRLGKVEKNIGSWATPLTVEETKDLTNNLINNGRNGNIIKVMDFIVRIENEPFSISETAALFESSNATEVSFKAVESLENFFDSIKIKTSVYILLKKRVVD